MSSIYPKQFLLDNIFFIFTYYIMDYKEKYIKYKRKYLELKYNQNGGSYSNIYVFNRLNNIIDQIAFKDYDETIHIAIDDKQLEEYAVKNTNAIKNIIEKQKKYKSKFFHVSINEFKTINDTHNNDKSWLYGNIYKNPIGVWISCGLSWQKFIGNSPSQWSLSTYVYEIIPSDNILKINNVNELEKFIKKYKKTKIHDIIDWKRVKKDYDGLVICPYLGDEIWGKNAIDFGIYGNAKNIEEYIQKSVGNKWKNDIYYTAEWYRHWETGTGVIWRKSGIKNIKLLQKLNTYDNLKYNN